MSTVSTTEESLIKLNPVTNYSTPTVQAGRRQGLNRALKTIKSIVLTLHNYLETLIVAVVTYQTGAHT
jgi:hypothetical protein